MKDLFKIIVDIDKLNPNFLIVKNERGKQAARTMLNEVYNLGDEIDKNFAEQFQTTGFDSRIWELYLRAVFNSLNFKIFNQHSSPDFELIKDENKVFIEAVTANTSNNETKKNMLEEMNELQKVGLKTGYDDLTKNSLLRIASALYSKLNKKYWDLNWVNGFPFIIAIQDFSSGLSNILPNDSIIKYLYGFDQDWHYNETGLLNVKNYSVEKFDFRNKSIPLGFFSLPTSEYVSGVIYSNCGTISKFTRMGKLKGYAESDVAIFRHGLWYDRDPNASLPIPFVYEVNEKAPLEVWEQGVHLFHNHKARYPVNLDLFPNIVHHTYDEKTFMSYIPNSYYVPIASSTMIMRKSKTND